MEKEERLQRTNVLLEDLKETFDKCYNTAVAKNNDYGGTNSNPFQNFSNSEIVGVSIPKGIMVRMMDKVSRVATLLEKESKVKDEAIEDTLEDLINYTAILKSYLKQQKGKAQARTIVEDLKKEIKVENPYRDLKIGTV